MTDNTGMKNKSLVRIITGLMLALGMFPLPVLAEEDSSGTLGVVFGVLALIGIVVFLILGITITVVAHNTDEQQDGL